MREEPMLAQEKADQGEALLEEVGLDCWLTFARETGIHFDPGVDQVVGSQMTWNSAFIFARGGQRLAIVGRHDVSKVRDTGVFPEVIGYDEGIQQVLTDTLRKLDPGRIGLNYSTDDSTADGLTHGQWLLLCELLKDTPYPARFTSAAPLLARLRGRKSPTEVERIRAAAKTTEEIVALIGKWIRPGISEAEIADKVHEEFKRRGLVSAWEWDSCPIVNTGPDSEAGHGMPRRDLLVEAGHLVHVDLGIVQDGYCSDLQRMWYVRRPGESAPPEEIRRAFATVVKAIEVGARTLKPGVAGHEVDAAARRVIVEAGYPEYKHALGHGLGRAVHDGGTLLGPRWERYGKTPEGLVEAGNVFTLEPDVATPAGHVGLEEDVVATAVGCEFLSSFQRELYLA
jgi:Xaa-Pro aminopeptidase